jgi:hypothetical protein
VTKETVINEAERYVARLVEKQNELGYKHPTTPVVRSAVVEAAEALKALSGLATKR